MHDDPAPHAPVPPELRPVCTVEHLQAALARALEQIEDLEEEKRQLKQAANHALWLTAL